MPIPQSQLETWSRQGGTAASTDAYASIRFALEKQTSPLNGRPVEIFLQGSYTNSTNIYADSDIDVVVLYRYAFYKDMSALTPAQQQLHEIVFPPATYNWTHLRDDVLAALRAHYGSNAVRLGTKSIKVETGGGRRTSDVVPAMEFRRYATFTDQNHLTAHWGMQFFDASNAAIVNYPKYHKENGEAKNQDARTRGRYKATIRLFKNLRNCLIDRRALAAGIAPSYGIECALYNVPDRLFVGDFSQTVPAILQYLFTTPYGPFMSQNSILPLIGDGPTQWSATNFAAFVAAAKDLWDNWR